MRPTLDIPVLGYYVSADPSLRGSLSGAVEKLGDHLRGRELQFWAGRILLPWSIWRAVTASRSGLP